MAIFVMMYMGNFPSQLPLTLSSRKGETAIAKTDRCVVRNQAYRRGEFSIRERHNERKNISYGNGDILPERSDLNVRFKSCNGTYEQEFNRMVNNGTVSLRGLKADAKVFDELVLDVNSAYFENRGGYDYAKQFFAEAYNLAVKEAGGEQYVLSAVLHADERNKALSEQYGRDIFHYHLHVVYVPVVDKEVRWSKRCKDPALVGTVRETIKQVSHSKKWPRFRDDSGSWVNSYSLLQDRFFEHMRAAGFTDFERGERGSTAEHLSVLEYKTQKETERAALLGEKAEKQEKQLAVMDKRLTVAKQSAVMYGEIEQMVKPARFGKKFEIEPANWQTISGLAKEGIKARAEIPKLKQQLADSNREITRLKTAYNRLYDEVKVFLEAVKTAPKRVMEFLQDILHRDREQREMTRGIKAKGKGQER